MVFSLLIKPAISPESGGEIMPAGMERERVG
jgi:hypothetical protein